MKTKVKYRGPKSLLPNNPREGMGYNLYWNWRVMPYGYQRRKAILNWLGDFNELTQSKNCIYINKKHCIILKRDPDLTRLLKQGKIWMDKEGSSKCTVSVLRLVEN